MTTEARPVPEGVPLTAFSAHVVSPEVWAAVLKVVEAVERTCDLEGVPMAEGYLRGPCRLIRDEEKRRRAAERRILASGSGTPAEVDQQLRGGGR